jgi:hypothetical protein
MKIQINDFSAWEQSLYHFRDLSSREARLIRHAGVRHLPDLPDLPDHDGFKTMSNMSSAPFETITFLSQLPSLSGNEMLQLNKIANTFNGIFWTCLLVGR